MKTTTTISKFRVNKIIAGSIVLLALAVVAIALRNQPSADVVAQEGKVKIYVDKGDEYAGKLFSVSFGSKYIPVSNTGDTQEVTLQPGVYSTEIFDEEEFRYSHSGGRSVEIKSGETTYLDLTDLSKGDKLAYVENAQTQGPPPPANTPSTITFISPTEQAIGGDNKLTITLPKSKTKATGNLTVQVQDKEGVKKVEWSYNGSTPLELKKTTKNAQAYYTTKATFLKGTSNVKITATDNSGQTTDRILTLEL
ncbi:MAG: hypothetical protein UR93_C0032G0002 [Berkelbacteria bacterium GW2011_GWA2_35_9]|uniref:Uncharacterized protein n=1 Tax=Berkelbacteria bacterium GW2011_GWA2_35_9 TaxID=1618333 RepID=A0A0G0DG78_9BACT|nr:MAG: hypothetical protein UR93_C0032G0002 [Berkelbacteria bacterium GW2011_GWA2_35_9]